MREILFRGKRIDNGEWVVGIPWIFAPPVNKAVIVYAMGLVGEDDDTSRYCECYEVDPSTIGQYTGLTDKNGKKIFEGDILENVNYDAENFRQIDGKLYADKVVYKHRGFVYYDEKIGGFCVKYEEEENGVVDERQLYQDYLGYVMGFSESGFFEEPDEEYNSEGTVIIGNIMDNPELLKNPELLEGKP